MKTILKRTWAPLLAVSLTQLVINSMPVSISGGVAEVISQALLSLGLYLATSFIGGAVHALLLRRRLDAGLTVCLLDGATIGLLSNLTVQLFGVVATQGSGIDLAMPPSGDADSVLWIWKLGLSIMILMTFGFIGLLSGGMGGGVGYLVSTWMTRSPTIGGRHD
jgi:hypothetical protein